MKYSCTEGQLLETEVLIPFLQKYFFLTKNAVFIDTNSNNAVAKGSKMESIKSDNTTSDPMVEVDWT